MPFNVGPLEIIIVLIIALIVIGPGKLPDVGAALGKSIREFRKAATDVKETTSLDAPAPAASPARAADAPAPAPTTAPPVPALAATPAAQAAAAPAEPGPDPASAGTGAAVEPVAQAAPEAGEWPAEVTPVDEQQPTASA